MNRPRRPLLLALAAGTAAALLILTPATGFAGTAEQPSVQGPAPDPSYSPPADPAPAPDPSYSPPADPGPASPPPSDAEQRAAAQTGRTLAQAEGTAFYSSFEPGDPQPAWTNTAETGAAGEKMSAGITGALPGGIPGSVADRVVEITASGEYTSAGEVSQNLTDGDANTKWLVFTSTGWVRYTLSAPVVVVDYALTSANDAPERDPRDWRVQGSTDGENWTTLDTRTGEVFTARFQRKEYRFTNSTAYRYYRLDITANGSGGIVQLAEWELSDGTDGSATPIDMRSQVGNGPAGGFAAKPRVGFTGRKAFGYAGGTTGSGGGYTYNKVFDVDIPVTGRTELSYVVFPEFTAADPRYASTYVAVDLAFSDGTYLRDLGARDQHGTPLNPRAQGDSKALYADQWNYINAAIGRVADGKTIKRILVGYDSPYGPLGFRGWLDDIKIINARLRLPYQARGPYGADPAPSRYVVTTRGTLSTGGFSRGNNFPATAVPHGFNFWTPVTNAGTTGWLYEYHRANDPLNLPRIQAFAASHEPSPWMGDRQTFQVMPSIATGTPDPSRTGRALPFRHDNETASPYRYGVTFDNGLSTEIAPADHAALFRFTFPATAGDGGAAGTKLIFDNVNNNGGLTLDTANGVVTGYSDVRSSLSTGATRMYWYAVFDKPVTGGAKLTGQGRDRVLGYLAFDAGPERTVTMRIASSLISIDQARHNLELEIGAADTVESIATRAQAAWDKLLGVIEVEGASDDQLVTLYSNLYRLHLYPNSAFENTGTADAPVYQHAVQSASTVPASTPDHTGAPVVGGKVYVNNGFWDTYRTSWPAYTLLSPELAGEMIDGFVRQYQDGGWIARWSSPGYADLMVGTSSDVAFADAYVKGVTGFDAQAGYDAALKNATVVPPVSGVGRKGLATSTFLGYTPVGSASQAMSWAMDGYINDFGIATMARALADRSSGAARQRYAEESEYFLNRARNYVQMFDPAVGFFQGRNADGTFRLAPEGYDPAVWGNDYTETDGWNMAFHVPQDGRGLADLYGGPDKLADKLDAFFATPETATLGGSYGGVIHEMREARDVRMGQYGHSNQPSHHIIYMYDYTPQPWQAQQKAREVLSRLYTGSEIGQGYPGDEDNGEMSSWYIFSALGFYPLRMGSPDYAIGSPLFTKATVHLANGKDLVISAPGNSARNVYVQGLMVNGQRWDRTYLPHDLIANGGVLQFSMGPRPSRWGTGPDAAPPSITTDDQAPAPLTDATGPGRGMPSADAADVAALFDNNAGTTAALPGGTPSIGYHFTAGAQPVSFYTLTSGPGDPAADPAGWVLEGSTDGGATWTVLDQRDGQVFRWRSQTRPFKVANPGGYTDYRIRMTGNGGAATTSLAEVELLDPAKAATSPLIATAGRVVASAGDTVAVPVTVTNYGTTPAAGQVTATVPAGWTVAPAAVAFGPLATRESTTVTFQVSVPGTAAPASYPIGVAVDCAAGPTGAAGGVTVIGDSVAFTPGTGAEGAWLYDAGGSQLDGTVYDGRARFTDGSSYATYRFALPPGVTGGTLAIDIGNQYLVQVSPDNRTWRTILVEPANVRDLSNRAERTFDLADLRGPDGTFYLRIADSQPQDGWGAWLARVTLTVRRAG